MPTLSGPEQDALARAVFDSLFRLGRLQPLVDDDRVENIIITGHDNVLLELTDGSLIDNSMATISPHPNSRPRPRRSGSAVGNVGGGEATYSTAGVAGTENSGLAGRAGAGRGWAAA